MKNTTCQNYACALEHSSQMMLFAEQTIPLNKLPQTNREQCVRLLAELLLSVKNELHGEGGADEQR